MNFPLILSISSLAVGGITYATIQTQAPIEDLSEPEAIVRPVSTPVETTTDKRDPLTTHAPSELEDHTLASAAEERLTVLESRIAELESENARLKKNPFASQVAGQIEEEQIGKLLQALSAAPEIRQLGSLGKDPAKILGLTTPAQIERFNEILAAFSDRYRDVVKLNTREDEASSNENMSVTVVEPFPEDGERLRQDLEYELSSLNGDPDKVDEALDALAPRYNNWGKSESRMMTMSGGAYGLKDGDGEDSKVRMMFQTSQGTSLKMPGGNAAK